MDGYQYIRRCNLTVSGSSLNGLDLSKFRIAFKIKKSDAQTPNTAEIRIYNLAPDTAKQIRKEFKRVLLQAGYEGNYGVIFDGNIKQVKIGRENNTDSYVDIAAGDGDDAYNYSVVNTTLAAGAKQTDQINAAAAAMAGRGVNKGFIAETPAAGLPRGKAMYGNARDYLRQSAEATATSWSIQDGKLQFISLTSVLPNQAVLLNEKTGLVGTPEQTNDGIRAKCLLNPMLKIGARVKINDTSDLKAGGIYRLLVVEHSGDTRGNEWHSELVCLDVDNSAPVGRQVKEA